jgi:hypothetical protein
VQFCGFGRIVGGFDIFLSANLIVELAKCKVHGKRHFFGIVLSFESFVVVMFNQPLPLFCVGLSVDVQSNLLLLCFHIFFVNIVMSGSTGVVKVKNLKLN